jgi:hypothetical protein
MDIGRWLRSVEAKQTLAVERKRAAWLGGVFKTEDITPDEWRAIQEHDKLVSE